jgi:hypothetical protein
MELASDDVKGVALAKIKAVKDLARALAFVETVAQEAKHTLVAARLTQVLLIERDSKKNQTKHCKPSRFCSTLFCVQTTSTFPTQKPNQACAIWRA